MTTGTGAPDGNRPLRRRPSRTLAIRNPHDAKPAGWGAISIRDVTEQALGRTRTH